MEELEALKELYSLAKDGLLHWKGGPAETEMQQVLLVDIKQDFELIKRYIEKNSV